jgi:hypothetical protein
MPHKKTTALMEGLEGIGSAALFATRLITDAFRAPFGNAFHHGILLSIFQQLVTRRSAIGISCFQALGGFWVESRASPAL